VRGRKTDRQTDRLKDISTGEREREKDGEGVRKMERRRER